MKWKQKYILIELTQKMSELKEPFKCVWGEIRGEGGGGTTTHGSTHEEARRFPKLQEDPQENWSPPHPPPPPTPKKPPGFPINIVTMATCFKYFPFCFQHLSAAEWYLVLFIIKFSSTQWPPVFHILPSFTSHVILSPTAYKLYLPFICSVPHSCS